MTNGVEQELQEATDQILQSRSRKKLVVAGPGTGKTFLFKKLLEASPGDRGVRPSLQIWPVVPEIGVYNKHNTR